MTIAIINPNSSNSMTMQMQSSCQSLGSNYRLCWHQCEGSPVSIEGHSDGVFAAYHVAEKIRELESERIPPKGYVIACFDDTGLDAARELTSAPVIGIGEAAMHAASFLSQRFLVMTTLERSVGILERNLRNYGMDQCCAGVYASGLPVLALESEVDSYGVFLCAARQVAKECRADALVLGCGGMSHWVAALQRDLDMPVLDGVRVAIKLAESFIDLNLSTSKLCGYAWPETK